MYQISSANNMAAVQVCAWLSGCGNV